MATTVTIAKSYFEALLRRAELHTQDSNQFNGPASALPGTITVAQAEYDYLRAAAREYNILRNTLFRGGLTPETLEVLLNGNGADEDDFEHPQQSRDGIFKKPAAVSVSITKPQPDQLTPDPSEPTNGNSAFLGTAQSFNRSQSFGETSLTPFDQDETSPADRIARPAHVPSEKRTLLFSNLAEKTTHRDLVSIVRGGRLLDIFIRQDRTATIAFVEGAQEFLAYAKRNDFYLHQKRLEVRWADRQFHIPGHVAAKIAAGATRNIVVRGGATKLSEEDIRDHLDHIHNLVVLDVAFRNNDVYISTNSVHNALFARTCMMSRTPYKGLRIEWYPDECASPLPKSRQPSYTNSAPQRKQQQTHAPSANIYAALLDMEDTENTSDEEGESPAIGGYDGVHLDWADTPAIAGTA